MKYLDFTLPTPAENLACDEALLDACECGGDEVLRFWEPATTFVVLGYANHAAREVNLEAAKKASVPVLRRLSGGGTVVQAPGSLNYSLILWIDGANAPSLRTIEGTNRFILERNARALETLTGSTAEIQGYTDLAIGGRKFSGNAQRRLKHCLIFHGTVLLNFDITSIENLLPMPSKLPCYRENRSHTDFLMNLKLGPEKVKNAFRTVWGATEELTRVPLEQIHGLASNRYRTDEWNFKF
jgi:lipoate---protein ligase